ncbi:N-acetylmuramoyl-L-alanine amidase [Bacillus marinisedimentorum]|uniref:N-acetylmuramoyl-L-alanine amidase n=1 Tax=Bacillus marinisedimentorum TaxID=1821260 RepID=UPI0008728A37|nr:N-acetylmuramoyl-L-alanine amidase [Bacillus marinisedimentorum]
MKTIVIDPGHGGDDTGATYRGYKEKDFNLVIASRVSKYLEKNYTVNAVMTRTTDRSMSLDERTDLANELNADFFLSIHHNAAGGKGFESFIFNGAVSPETKYYQNIIHYDIITSVKTRHQVTDRGKKRANFHVLRETKMSSLLLEVLFIDHARNLETLKDPAFIVDVSEAIAKGTARALRLHPKPAAAVLYKVISGSFRTRKLAEERNRLLAAGGIDSFITQVVISGKNYFRVQAGAFSNRENAVEQMRRLEKIGIANPFIVTDLQKEQPPSPKIETQGGELLSITGETHLSARQLDQYAKTVNPDAPELGRFYMKYGNIYGIRADAAFAQAIHETDYFRFTGLVDKKQNNYAGIGATGAGNQGAEFKTPESGVHAHIQHLYAYSTVRDIPEGTSLVDPRFGLVTRGSAELWTDLNGKWAVPGKNYGQKILQIYKQMVGHAANKLAQQEKRLEALLGRL